MYTVLRVAQSWWIVEVASGKRRMGPFATQARAAGIASGPLFNALADLSR